MAYFESEFITTQDRVDDAFAEALTTSRVFPTTGKFVFLARGIPIPKVVERLRQSRTVGPFSASEIADTQIYTTTCQDVSVEPFKASAMTFRGDLYFDDENRARNFFPELAGLPESIREAVIFADIKPVQPHVYLVQFEPGATESKRSAGFLGFRARHTQWLKAHYEVKEGSWDFRRIGHPEEPEEIARFKFTSALPSTFDFVIPDKNGLSEGDKLYLIDWFSGLKRDYARKEQVLAGQSS